MASLAPITEADFDWDRIRALTDEHRRYDHDEHEVACDLDDDCSCEG